MPACSTFPVFPNTRPRGNVIFREEVKRARAEVSCFYTLGPYGQLLSWDGAPAKRCVETLAWFQGLGSSSVRGWREVLAGAGLTWGTLPKAHGVAGSPLESRLQGLVSLPPGCREA